MEYKDDSVELLNKLIDRLCNGTFATAYDFGYCQGLISARDILEGKSAADRTKLSWPEQFYGVHLNDLSYVVAALAAALDPEAAKKGDRDQLDKIISNIAAKLSISLDALYNPENNTTFFQTKKIDENHEEGTLQDLIPVCDQKDTIERILALKIIAFARNKSYYESSYHFGAFCELITLYNTITGQNLSTPIVPKVFSGLTSQDALLAAMFLAKNNSNSDRTKEIYEQIQNNTDYTTVQDIRDIDRPDEMTKVDLSDPNIVKA
jgi:hypothetical protein